MNESPIYRLHAGGGNLIATGVHDGHAIREELLLHVGLAEADRLREEDPFTAIWTEVAPTRVVATRSRFEVDLNRPRESATYRKPEDCWGLELFNSDPPGEMFERSLAQYDGFYRDMFKLLSDVTREHGRFIVYDLHSYNHRRQGPGGPTAEPEGNPQVNVGTASVDRSRWGGVVDAFVSTLRGHDFPSGALDVRENIKFQGGHWSRWIHQNFPTTGVALAIEFKKFFMDEWSGEPDEALIAAIGNALRATVPPVLAALEQA